MDLHNQYEKLIKNVRNQERDKHQSEIEALKEHNYRLQYDNKQLKMQLS